jgi:SAM-dependent methyltransferase
MNRKDFYERHKNFSCRTPLEYFISPGIRCKFDLIKYYIGSKVFNNVLDLGCSGNSFLYFLNSRAHKSFYDIAITPLKNYFKLNKLILQKERKEETWHPLCGDITNLPYKDESFDLVCALDVLEHIKEDTIAVSEMSRILKTNGIAVISVPHLMKYYTFQDSLIGHYRRYEIDPIIKVFKKFNLANLKIFGIYGKLMRISQIQSKFPKKTEENLMKLRKRYRSKKIFHKLWDIFVIISTKLMKMDAKYHSIKEIMNVGFIFIKHR